jgi:quinol monooxygenase YgiN
LPSTCEAEISPGFIRKEFTLIRHIVFFTAEGPDRVAEVKRGLAALATIPGSRTFEVTENLKADLYDNSIDLVVYAEFDDEAALAAYKAHPTYAATTASVKPLRQLRFSADVRAA